MAPVSVHASVSVDGRRPPMKRFLVRAWHHRRGSTESWADLLPFRRRPIESALAYVYEDGFYLGAGPDPEDFA